MFVIFAGVFVFAVYNIIAELIPYGEAESEYNNLAKTAYVRLDEPNSTNNPENSDGTPENIYQSPIDFNALKNINPDIIGWIRIDGTVIDYPIVKCDNNDKYLNTTFEGKRNKSGAIFMDYLCEPDFSGPNSIIYGHKMNNGSMFAALTGYKKQDFCDQYPDFTIYLPDREYTCEIFSAYVTAAESKTYTVYYADTNDFADYISYATNKSLIKTDVEVLDTDRIITLSTCDYQFDDARMIVHAVIKEVNR